MTEYVDQLNSVILEIDRMLPQLSEFISQFNTTILQHGINVTTDTQGNMDMDVPASMPEATYNKVSQRLGIIDRLINNHGSSLNDLFKKGLSLEQQIKETDTQYTSTLMEQISTFKRLNASYKH
jgi:hypothetical protein